MLGHLPAVASTAGEAIRILQVVHADLVIVDMLGLKEASCGDIVASLASASSSGSLPSVCVLGPRAFATDCSYNRCRASRLAWPVQLDSLAKAIRTSLGDGVNGRGGDATGDAALEREQLIE